MGRSRVRGQPNKDCRRQSTTKARTTRPP